MENSSGPTTSIGLIATPQTYRKWNWWIGGLSTLAVAGFAIGVGGIFYLGTLAQTGVSGTEFFALLLIPFFQASFAFAIAAFVIGLIHLVKHKPAAKSKSLTVVCLVISGLITAYGVYSIVASTLAVHHFKQQEQQAKDQLKEQTKSYEPKEVTEARATELINTCQIRQFYYGPNKNVADEVEIADKSTSGVVLTSISGNPWRLTASAQEGTKLLPTVRAAQKQCEIFINRDN